MSSDVLSDITDLDHDVEKALTLLNFYELVEGRPPFHLDEFDEKARKFEEGLHFDRLLLFSGLALTDIVLSIVVFNDSLVLCADNTDFSWQASLSLLNMVAVLLRLLLSACAFKHALFTNHPVLYLAYICYAWIRNYRDGPEAAVRKANDEWRARAEDVPQESLSRIVNGFFASNRLAIMIAFLLKFHKHAIPSAALIVDALIVGINYSFVFYNQIRLCVDMQDPMKQPVVGFLCSWCLRGNAQIYILPIIMSVLIWENMTGQTRLAMCMSSAPWTSEDNDTSVPWTSEDNDTSVTE